MAGFVAIVVSIGIFCFPPHPAVWRTLHSGMTRSDVVGILQSHDGLKLVERRLTPPSKESPHEIWMKQYWGGQWTIRCIYFRRQNTLRLVTVTYESYIFPHLSRMRHYD